MKPKVFSQFGTLLVIIFIPLIIFFVIILFLPGFDETVEIIILSVLLLVFIICILIFYRLTIYIDDTHISFKLGIGLIKKKYQISDIVNCKPVRNPVWYGIGIRWFPGGILYNVSGLNAIELTFKNKKSKVRIGTDKPDEIAREVNKIIGLHVYPSENYTGGKSQWAGLIILLFFILFLPAYLIYYGNQELKVDLDGSSLIINGAYGLTINNSDLKQIDTLSSLPAIRSRTNGYAFGKMLKGNFRLEDGSYVKLYIKKDSPPYINLATTDLVIYINFDDPVKTIDLFKKIKDTFRKE